MKEERTRHGDPSFLDVALKSLEDMRKLQGLDRPQAIDLTLRVSEDKRYQEALSKLPPEVLRQIAALPSPDAEDIDITPAPAPVADPAPFDPWADPEPIAKARGLKHAPMRLGDDDERADWPI